MTSQFSALEVKMDKLVESLTNTLGHKFASFQHQLDMNANNVASLAAARTGTSPALFGDLKSGGNAVNDDDDEEGISVISNSSQDKSQTSGGSLSKREKKPKGDVKKMFLNDIGAAVSSKGFVTPKDLGKSLTSAKGLLSMNVV